MARVCLPGITVFNTHQPSSDRKVKVEATQYLNKLSPETKKLCLNRVLDIAGSKKPAVVMGDTNIKKRNHILDYVEGHGDSWRAHVGLDGDDVCLATGFDSTTSSLDLKGFKRVPHVALGINVNSRAMPQIQLYNDSSAPGPAAESTPRSDLSPGSDIVVQEAASSSYAGYALTSPLPPGLEQSTPSPPDPAPPPTASPIQAPAVVPQGLPLPQTLPPPTTLPPDPTRPMTLPTASLVQAPAVVVQQGLPPPPAAPPPRRTSPTSPPQPPIQAPAVVPQGLPPPIQAPAVVPQGLPPPPTAPQPRRTSPTTPQPRSSTLPPAAAAVAGAQTAAQGLPTIEPPADARTAEAFVGEAHLHRVMADANNKIVETLEQLTGCPEEIVRQLQSQAVETRQKAQHVVSLSDTEGSDSDAEGPSGGATGHAAQGSSGGATGSAAQGSSGDAAGFAARSDETQLRLKGITQVEDSAFVFDSWEETIHHRYDLHRVRRAALAAENGIYSSMVGNIETLTRPGRELAMKMYKDVWRKQKGRGQDLTEGQLEEVTISTMKKKGEPIHAINQRLKRQFNAAIHKRFGLTAAWVYLEWGYLDETVKAAMADASRERREDIPSHGGTPGSADRSAATAEAAQARRKARNAENQTARWEAANQEEGFCEQIGCLAELWWTRRTRCLHCFRKVGQCCQVCVSSGASGPSEQGTWYLVCKRCEKTNGLDAPVDRAINPNLPKPRHCAYHLAAPKPSEVKCRHCFRWLCSSCCKSGGPPHECRSCPEAF